MISAGFVTRNVLFCGGPAQTVELAQGLRPVRSNKRLDVASMCLGFGRTVRSDKLRHDVKDNERHHYRT
jgi:hypothetical protein